MYKRQIEGDAEVVALAIHLLLESGLTDFQLDIGHVGLFKALVAEAGMDEETVSQLRVLIESKNYFGVEALSLIHISPDVCDKVIAYSGDSEEVVRYLKCETLQVDPNLKNGWYLICVDEFALGWGKVSNGTLKNKYPSGWRLV